MPQVKGLKELNVAGQATRTYDMAETSQLQYIVSAISFISLW